MSKIIAVDVNETTDYICKCDKDDPNPVVWKLGVLDSLIRGKLDKFDMEWNPEDSQAKVKANFTGREIEYVRYGLKGFENFLDKNGKSIQFRTVQRGPSTLASDEVLQLIPIEIIKELSAEIVRENRLTPEAIKN